MLEPSLATILITILNLVILFFILRAILFKPVTKFMEARRDKIKLEIETAAQDRQDAAALRASYEEKLKKAGAEGADILQKAQNNAEKSAEKIIADAKKQAEYIVNSARAQMAAERQAAFLVFKREAASLVLAAVSKLLKREVSGEDARNFALNALNDCALGGGFGSFDAAGKAL